MLLKYMKNILYKYTWLYRFLPIKSASQNMTSEDKVYYQIWLPEQKPSNKNQTYVQNFSVFYSFT